MSTPRVVALVPMRDRSERVPGKNYRTFAGRPLFHHVVEVLLESEAVAAIAIDTDSAAVRRSCAETFPQVVLIDRPLHLRDGAVPMNDVLLHDVRLIEADCYVQTHSTNPLLRPRTVAAAVQAFLAGLPHFDSLFSVTRLQTRLWDSTGRPMNHDPAVLLRTQDLPPVFEENSCLYAFRRETLEARGSRIGARPQLFEIDAREAWDIDEELDFEVAEFLYGRRREASR